MSQHFLLSKAARSLSLARVARLSDEEAHDAFRLIRWTETKGEAVCPRCACAATYTYKARKLWKCKACSPSVLRHERHHLRQPQDADPRHPARHRDLRERRQGP